MYSERGPPIVMVYLSQVALYLMSHTIRTQSNWSRTPSRQQERRQLRCLKADQAMWDLDISPCNRLNRQIRDEWYDWKPSANFELDYVN